MILYHGSAQSIKKPDLSFSRNNTDFGRGFYTTSIKEQAIRWSYRFKRRYGYGIISMYEVDEANQRKNTSILELNSYSDAWLHYIAQCRRGISDNEYDLVIGGIANDDVYNTLTLFFGGYIDNETAIKRLQYENPNIQYCFKSQVIIDKHLIYIGMEKI